MKQEGESHGIVKNCAHPWAQITIHKRVTTTVKVLPKEQAV